MLQSDLRVTSPIETEGNIQDYTTLGRTTSHSIYLRSTSSYLMQPNSTQTEDPQKSVGEHHDNPHQSI